MSVSIFILHFLAQLPNAHTAPTQNLTALRTEIAPSWVDGPNGRGSWDILYSCVFTLSLCVWTAIHPNVPGPGEREHKNVRLKIFWVLIGIFAPEIGVVTAFKQYRQARLLVSKLSQLKEERLSKSEGAEGSKKVRTPASNSDKSAEIIKNISDEPFSQRYGFHVVMGGLAVNVNHLHDRIRKLVLTPNGVLYLAQKGHFFEISEKDIKDKSKASWFTKALVVLQILWTILQCLYRKAAGFPLTVLEVHTLVHAGCALIMYSLWFHKPLDVEEPLTISNDGIDHYIALMLVQTYNFGTQPFGNLVLPLEFQPAKLSGSRFGDWPGHQGSEAMYLMFKPPDQSNFANAESGDSRDTSESSSVHNGSNPSPLPNKPKGMITGLSSSYVDAVSNQVWTVDLSSNRTPSNQDLDQNNLLRHQFGSSRIRAFAPGVGRRRRELHMKKARLAKRGERLGQVLLGSKGELSAVQSGPPDGIKVVASFSTGQFTSNGIGPAAFLTGQLRQQYQLDGQPPPKFVEVPPEIRRRLPLGQCNLSSIAHCLSLKISLSEKDERRWNLAGLALQEEYSAGILLPSQLPSPSDNDSDPIYIGFSNRGSTLNTSYFTTYSPLLRLLEHIKAEAYPATYGSQPDTNRGIVFLRGIYHRLLEAEEIKLGATSAVLMLPGVLYGALHLTLWLYDFPTTAEELLWKISAVTLIAVPVLLALPFAGWATLRRSRNKEDAVASSAPPSTTSTNGAKTPENAAEPKIPIPVSYSPPVDSRNVTASLSLVNEVLLQMAVVAVVLVTTLYIFARVFIIVESFISLRHVPLGVYTDVGWPKYIPHL